MQNQIEHVINQLQQVKPDEYGDCVDQLNHVLAGFSKLPDKELAVPAMLALIERYPDADMGSPGPLVHEMEGIFGYEGHLEESLTRAPTALTCWMANRLLNAQQEGSRQRWLQALQRVANNPSAPQSAQAEAREFLRFQGAPG
ncbi:hypothetical protein EIP75_23695 [Aquabacterium soli]|jgi:hypothetical protein|uniref:Uncharacterized protein n=1 Tax=Aquabacterium soli TaxID=2493092 RepID=A0A426UZ99_9BURK|nr:hypothetical protein [Aquabacterium soli]RRR99885.1 hypothetical protein EIP75_23695 [Aquabacterium soli]